MISNGVCDPECDNNVCNYDESDCKRCAPDCTLQLLNNEVCDQACNTYNCKFDNKACGYCFPTCPQQQQGPTCDLKCAHPNCRNNDLCFAVSCTKNCNEGYIGDTAKDTECDVERCFYDGGDFGHCRPGCEITMLQDGNCDLPCAHVLCDHDSGDCKDQTCAPGCNYEQVGDYKCDPECNVIECGFDNGDCVLGADCWLKGKNGKCDKECNTYEQRYDSGDCFGCYPSCDETFLTNNKCDLTCQHFFCNWDNYQCDSTTPCASDCTTMMVGNFVCDQACQTKECLWDGGDCGYCAPGCYNTMLFDGICQDECFNLECGFDALDCGNRECAPGCTLNLSRNSVCDTACMNSACQWDSGKCDTTYCSYLCIYRKVHDTTCDLNCASPACSWDSGMCDSSECAPGCTFAMLRNSVCDPICRKKACFWDATDCNECSPGCPPSKLGDGVCQPECAVPECNFDMKDCWSLECATGCKYEMLDNATCNDDVCNAKSCWWDVKNCYYCAAGCLITNIGDGTCQSECQVPECGYDINDCKNVECSPGCLLSQLKNGKCDSACLTQACRFDEGDCGYCSPGCLQSMLNNGVCDYVCTVPSCDFDYWDCKTDECAPGCNYTLMLNNVCDDACNNLACGFDNERCKCSPACTYEMMRKDKCNVECANEFCGWDGGKCDCNNGLCKVMDRGKCKKECLVFACSFDGYFDPTILVRCNDAVKVRLSLAYSMLRKNWGEVYDFDAICTSKFPKCNYSRLENGLQTQTCPRECNHEGCMYALGLCNEEQPSNCLASAKAVEGYCLFCDTSVAYSLYSYCPLVCPRYYKPNDHYHICEPIAEQATTPDNPDIIYVADGLTALSSTNKGTRENPYTSLSLAFAGVWQSYTTIYLLKGWHPLHNVPTNEPDGMLVNYPDNPFLDVNSSKRLVIQTLFCSQDPHPLCGTGRAVIRLTEDVTTITVHNTLEIIDVDIDGENILAYGGMWKPYCEVGNETPGMIGAPLLVCSYYSQAKYFVLLEKSTLFVKVRLMQNVEVRNIRNQPFSIFYSEGADMTFQNVNFLNIELGQSGINSIIVQLSCALTDCGSFKYTTGVVSRLNDIGDYNATRFLGVFLFAFGFSDVYIEDVEFSYNNYLAGRSDDTTTSFYALISLNTFITFTVKNCKFLYNLAKEGVILVNSKKLSLEEAQRSLTHITLENLVFAHNFGERAVVRLSATSDLLNIFLSNLTFDSNVCAKGAVLKIEYMNVVADSFKYGRVDPTTNEKFPPRWVNVTNIVFRRNAASTGSLDIYHFANVNMSSLVFINNIDVAINDPLASLVIPGILALKPPLRMTATTIVDIAMLPCIQSAIFSGSYHYTLTQISFLSNVCDGYAGMVIQGPVVPASITDVSLMKNTGGLGVLKVFSAEQITFTRWTLRNNVSSKDLVSIMDSSKVGFATSTFEDNQSVNAGIYASLSVSLTIVGSQFSRNTAVYGPCVYYTAASKDSTISISSTMFSSNSAKEDGGVLYLYPSALGVILLQLSDSTFSLNNAGHSGSALYVAVGVRMNPLSVVTGCTVADNSAISNGAFYLQYKTGTLTITTTSFLRNVGANGSAITCQHEEGAILQLTSCVFRLNQGASTLYKTGLTLRPAIRSVTCQFYGNSGSVVVMENGEWTDTGSEFADNKGRGILIMNNAAVKLTKSTLQHNVGADTGGAVMVSSRTEFTCIDCEISYNSASDKGGAIYLEQSSVLTLLRSYLHDNHCDIHGSALYFLECQGNSTIQDSVFQRNENGKLGDAVLMLFSARLTILNTTISDNVSSYTTPGVMMIMGTLFVANSNIYNQHGSLGSLFLVITFSYLSLSNCTLSNSFAQVGGAIAVTSSNITMTDCALRQMVATTGGALSASTGSFIVGTRLSVEQVYATNLGGVFSLIESSLTLSGGEFIGFVNGCVFGEKVPSLDIRSVTMRDGRSSLGGAIYCSRCQSVMILDTRLTNNSALVGGALYLTSPPDTNISSAYSLQRVLFQGNQALNGGGLYTNNIKLTADTLTFQENQANQIPLNAESGQGGAATLSCTDNSECFFKFSNSEFQNNSATLQAGAVMWTDVEPNYDNATIFKDNSAFYGSDMASYPVSMGAMEPSGSVDPSSSRRLATNGLPIVRTIYGVASGQDQRIALSLALLDHYHKVVKVDNFSAAFLMANDMDKTTISGQTKTTAEMGVFLFSTFRVTAMPNTTVVLRIETSTIDLKKAAKSGSLVAAHSAVGVELHMRECILGETLQGLECLPCPYGKYTLTPEIACQTCPVGANCFGGGLITPKPGYWRSSIYSARFFVCLRESSCLGSPEDPDLGEFYFTGRCSTGYHGSLCQSCEFGYSRSGKNQCGKCPPAETNRVRIAFIMLAMLIFVVYTVRKTMKTVYQPQAITSVYIKIIVNYLQLIVYASNFRLNWPNEVEQLYSTHRSAEEVSEQLYSYDCFLQNSKNTAFNEDVYYTKKILLAAYPALFTLVATLFWVVMSRWKNNPLYLRKHLPATIVILFFIYHPTITQSMFSVYSCQELEPGEFWLTDDMSVQCWHSKHVFYSLVVALPSIILWVFIVPISCLLHLIKHQRILFSDDVLFSRYSFLTKGYNKRHFYWEFVILLRKISVICVLVFMNNVNREIQTLTVLVILFIVVYLQYKVRPFYTETLNLMELLAILVTTITIYCGLFFLSNELDNPSTWFFFIVIVLANAVFLVSWAFNLLHEILKKAGEFIPLLGKRLIPAFFFSDPMIDDMVDNPVGRKESIVTHPVKDYSLDTLFGEVMKADKENLTTRSGGSNEKLSKNGDITDSGKGSEELEKGELNMPGGDIEPSVSDISRIG